MKNVFIALLVLVLLAVTAGVVAILLSREQATVAVGGGNGSDVPGQMENRPEPNPRPGD